ncbi:DTW domain-containing protein [Paraglaciecola aquimarina]|uniref:tRNA-uridine aminocarboxypropyltransferase n=1 Tax=Paraglaciecola aquimarina TaxID=1235557 RepID=A0ABU3SZ36_9ALTE|nr:DTW domain-containing protein [Paraglaciecola aquimarina]MDU0355251.1 DTW domain-containing protein [Paraglaciecola aquimarina]
MIPKSECICSQRPIIQSDCAFCLLMYKDEYYKPSNTGRVIADVIPDNHAFVWHRVTPDPELLALLKHPDYAPIVVFPHEYALAEQCIDSPLQIPAVQQGKSPCLSCLMVRGEKLRKCSKVLV